MTILLHYYTRAKSSRKGLGFFLVVTCNHAQRLRRLPFLIPSSTPFVTVFQSSSPKHDGATLWSTRRQNADYVEILVPALEPRFDVDGEESAGDGSISCMPDWAQPVFADVESLNQVQSRVYERALFSQENLLVCAPFLPGETTQVALLPILEQVKDVKGNYVIAYVVPTDRLLSISIYKPYR
ncbi:hypothetical protein M0R45_027710 [Rubus argutus]|uniref:Uncharacterized protein n=1 Tax=Rubus argutus TaxID=59490 RepID=A0AAW1X300_RUBAR